MQTLIKYDTIVYMFHLLSLVQLILALLLITLVLIQRANTDASGALGTDGGGAVLVKRGAEKYLHQLTIIIAILFTAALSYTIFIH